MSTTRGLIAVVAITALVCLLLRPALLAQRNRHGPEYLWHRYLSALEGVISSQEEAAVVAKRAIQEDELAAKTSSLAERRAHEEQAASWKKQAFGLHGIGCFVAAGLGTLSQVLHESDCS
jgi:hypothetical protein